MKDFRIDLTIHLISQGIRFEKEILALPNKEFFKWALIKLGEIISSNEDAIKYIESNKSYKYYYVIDRQLNLFKDLEDETLKLLKIM